MLPAFGENYTFSWADLGDIALGRRNLGSEVPVAIYRLAQYTMREAVRLHFSEEMARILLRDAGWIAGREFCLNTLDVTQDFNSFITQLQETMKALKIGILRIEKVDHKAMTLVLTMSEDLDCSGLPIQGTTVCDYDEGFLAGILYAYTGKQFSAVEVDCWATGDRTCRFEVNQDPGTR